MKKALKWCGVLVLSGLAIAAILVVFANTQSELQQMTEWAADWQDKLRIVRWSIVAALIVFWDEFCEVLSKVKNLDKAQLDRAKALRWRVCVSLAAFEILVIESVPVKIFGA